jgi:hypothetical protein
MIGFMGGHRTKFAFNTIDNRGVRQITSTDRVAHVKAPLMCPSVQDNASPCSKLTYLPTNSIFEASP